MRAEHTHLTSGRLTLLVASRFVLNAVFRIAYPLVPLVALRYGVDENTATWIVTIQVIFGLLGPLGGWLGERIGYRQTMLIGLAGNLIGVLGIAAVAPLPPARAFPLIVACYGVCGMSVALYQPTIQAYVGALTPYHQRGRSIGLVELSWALSGMIAVPVLLWIADTSAGLSGAFLMLAATLAIATLATYTSLPAEPSSVRATSGSSASLSILNSASVRGLAAFLFLALAGNELFFIVQPTWTVATFNATSVDLGTASLVFGVGELCGSLASTLFTDRLGKRRAATLGFALAAAVFVAMPLLAFSWASYLGMYFLFALCIEFGIVAALTFASTVRVIGRATVMALATMAIQVGRATASRVAVPLLAQIGFGGNALVGAVMLLAGVAIALRFSHEDERTTLETAA